MNTGFHAPGYHLPEKLKHFNKRERRWLWNELAKISPGFPLERSIEPANIEQIMSKQIMRLGHEENYAKDTLDKRENMLINEEQFYWVKKGGCRLHYWILVRTFNYALGRYFVANPFEHSPIENWYSDIQLAFDTWEAPLNTKEKLLADLKSEWSNTHNSSEAKWLSQEEKSQVEWAWNYLYKRNMAVTILSPASHKELYTATLSSIDHIHYQNAAERKLFMQQMKRSWSQIKYRGSEKAKKQVAVQMTETTKKKFEKILKHEYKSTAEVVEEMINNKYESIYGK